MLGFFCPCLFSLSLPSFLGSSPFTPSFPPVNVLWHLHCYRKIYLYPSILTQSCSQTPGNVGPAALPILHPSPSHTTPPPYTFFQRPQRQGHFLVKSNAFLLSLLPHCLLALSSSSPWWSPLPWLPWWSIRPAEFRPAEFRQTQLSGFIDWGNVSFMSLLLCGRKRVRPTDINMVLS